MSSVSAQESLFDETKTISDNNMWYISASLAADESYSFFLAVESGNAVDLLVMDKTNFDIYKDAFTTGNLIEFSYYSTYSALNMKSKTYTISVDSDITLYFIIENTDFTDGGASGGGSVDVHMTLSAVEDSPGFEWIIEFSVIPILAYSMKIKKR